MPEKALIRTVPHSAGHMFAMVADVERYPQFLPGCGSLKVLSRGAEGKTDWLVAQMSLVHRLIGEPLRSRVTLDRSAQHIIITYISGPLANLTCDWTFTDLEKGTSQVDFHIAFEAKGRLLGLLVAAVFEITVDRLISAFETRAAQLEAGSV
ncbi:MAG: type II toxin-antitoxin system RatA family toxin [Alphaproteobacteria bacterium]